MYAFIAITNQLVPSVMVVMGTGVRVAVTALHIDLQYIYPIEKQTIFSKLHAYCSPRTLRNCAYGVN